MVKNMLANAGDVGLISGSERSPGGGHGNPLQYPCLENPMDRGAWRATVHAVPRVRHDLATRERKRTGLYSVWLQTSKCSREQASKCSHPIPLEMCKYFLRLLVSQLPCGFSSLMNSGNIVGWKLFSN